VIADQTFRFVGQEVVEEARAERLSREGLSPGRRAKKVLSHLLL
jgi:hypothetical protein